jgi:Holliday junction resolvase RusA-like endonuclease
MMQYELIGKPISQQRPRLMSRNNVVYNPQSQDKLKAFLEIKAQHFNKPLYHSPLHMEVVFEFAIPSYYSKAQRLLLLGKPYDKHKDIDNI